MEPKEAIEILQKLLENESLSEKEKEAITTAIGMLSWTSLARSSLKARRAKRDKNLEW
jgi:hypothetical protein